MEGQEGPWHGHRVAASGHLDLTDLLDHTWALWGGGLEVNLAFKAVIPSTAPSSGLSLAPLSGFSSP